MVSEVAPSHPTCRGMYRRRVRSDCGGRVNEGGVVQAKKVLLEHLRSVASKQNTGMTETWGQNEGAIIHGIQDSARITENADLHELGQHKVRLITQ